MDEGCPGGVCGRSLTKKERRDQKLKIETMLMHQFLDEVERLEQAFFYEHRNSTILGVALVHRRRFIEMLEDDYNPVEAVK